MKANKITPEMTGFDPDVPGRDYDRIDAAMLVDVITEPFYVDSNVTTGCSYTYAVSAFDVAGNESSQAQADVTVPRPAPRTPQDPKFQEF